jgi:phosphoenolpyruvate synthase/pyruvate phosphate dikinase/glycerol-3-phosphate acyltransferase PlsY
MFELWGILVVFVVCPLLGAMPLIAWITQALSRQKLAQVGTGNISVSSAFYHGGTLVGTLAVFSEALKGIAAVLLARAFFGNGSAWELIALIALVLGRYWVGRGAGTTNVVWGFAVHDTLASVFVLLLAGTTFSIIRSRKLAKFGVLILLPLIIAILHPENPSRIYAAIALAALLSWIYKTIPDDLDLPPEKAQAESQAAFQFLRGEGTFLSLKDKLDAGIYGHKAARLSDIHKWGYSVPKGWVLAPGDDPASLIEFLQPSDLSPLVVRSSAIGEDSEYSSAAGQYETVLNVTTKDELQQAIAQVRASYNHPTAVQYRRDRSLNDVGMAVLIQQQVQGVFSGVAFTRDPITQRGDAVVIEALPGNAAQIVSGRVTPEQYRAFVVETENFASIQLEGEGQIPSVIIKQVAYLARHIEEHYHGIPQDIEWSHDGQTLWVLQARPISTLLPIWTRKIAAEVIPGLIRPLTWSINRPLTCSVWGRIFSVVLGKRAVGLDFNQTATLHYSRAYFNASLLGGIFKRMGLPPESLEFLTQGAKMSKPPLATTLRNLPGLTRLAVRELSLEKDFNRDNRRKFVPTLSQLAQESVNDLQPAQLLARIDLILELLQSATYYSIMAPLSAALRQAIFRVKDEEIDHSFAPEVAVLRSLDDLAVTAKQTIPELNLDQVFGQLAQTPQGQEILEKFEKLLQRYGYLSEVGTDIAVPTWKEQPQAFKQLFVQFMQGTPPSRHAPKKKTTGLVQRRVNLKGRVTEIYSQLLAELRWSFVALENTWLTSGLLRQPGDLFFLQFDEVRRLVENSEPESDAQLQTLVQQRQSQLNKDGELNPVPFLIYGNNPPPVSFETISLSSSQRLLGIPASPGKVEGKIKVLQNFNSVPEVDRGTILVVPYTDSGWATLIVRAGGLIAETGGRLSHGAILAREYGIPAIMDVRNITSLLQDGQRVRIDGYTGVIEICE